MIPIRRGDEPNELTLARDINLVELRKIGSPLSKDIPDTYRNFGQQLRVAQNYKCCYCEIFVQKGFNDVEHYRPKGRADRLPGCAKDHGYWWLAYTWDNLLFACPNCNRSGKNDLFPLAIGSTSLIAEGTPPGKEIPLFIDPAGNENPVVHIEFVFDAIVKNGPKQWWARPRNGSKFGERTISVCNLNRQELLELRAHYFETVVQPQISAILKALHEQDAKIFQSEFDRALAMIGPKNQFAAFTYDCFCSRIPPIKFANLTKRTWPQPSEVGV